MKPLIKFLKRKDGVKIAYTTFGNGKPLIYPSAWVSDLAFSFSDKYISQFWEALSQYFTIVLYDKHGCGQSDRNRTQFSLEAELIDLETVIDHLQLDDMTLFGMSCAGPVALEFTYRHPKKVSFLILYSTWMNGNDIVNQEMRTAIAEIVKTSWGFGSKMMIDLMVPGASPEVAENLARMQRACCTPEMAAELLLLGYSLDVSHRISHISANCLVLHRTKDKTVPVAQGRDLALELPDAVFKLNKGNIHLPWMGNSLEIIDDIISFVHGDSFLERKSIIPEKDEKNATIVFTDIVSSTRMVEKLGDREARYIFKKHDQIIRDELEKFGGHELQNLGDGFMLSFDTASSALRCAAFIQQSITEKLASVSIRIGIHTGEVIIREGNQPFGQAVVKSARIVNQCNGGQILLSDVTRQLCSGANFNLEARGKFVPKGFDEPLVLYELLWKC
jgi:class 3 adenylate cyclase/pimeloyl-ACP methyl ester carboxylesterase